MDRFGKCIRRRKTVQRLELTCEIIGGYKVAEAGSKLIVASTMEALYDSALDRAAHPIGLDVRPPVVELREPVFGPVYVADHIKTHSSGVNDVPVSGLLEELITFIE